MLIDAKLRNLKPAEMACKVSDGKPVTVLPGTISFRYNYRLDAR